ncbi:isoprenylcysteine carboxyl methyltransferase family protein [Peribacillus sp. SCS-37]|uniref:isoprenylcysteine carboxyl methyltransferase family protein n=1 Tax=Paraperibacillus esterisolvens TaxID=3115296 RepID=UPI00390620DE
MFFAFFLGLVILQRLLELVVAKRNETWMKSRGGEEFGAAHYPWMVGMHASFFAALSLEVFLRNFQLSPQWKLLFVLFLILQAGRIWALRSLGRFWNTKIIVVRGAKVVKKGPYRFLKHPNYVIVALELLVIPLIFNAFWTASLFTLLNILMMKTRIPAEEAALKSLTDYRRVFSPTDSSAEKI